MNTRNESNSPVHSRPVIFGATLAAFLITDTIFAVEAHAQATIVVPGIVRDFQKSHPDFNIVPGTGYGHYAGSVAEPLGGNLKPQFQPGGYKVALEWRNTANLPIAPHLARGVGPLQLVSAPLVDASATLDSFDPDTGTILADKPDILTGTTMPAIVPPTDLGPSVGNFLMNTDPETISTGFLCDSFSTKDFAILRIDGDVTIHCLGNFNMMQTSSIELLPGATLKIYVGGTFKTFQGSKLNANTLDPRRCWIYNYGTWMNDISQDSIVSAVIVSPNASLELGQDVQFYGSFIGDTVDMKQGSGFHSAALELDDMCGVLIEDRLGVPGSFNTGGITSAATFDHWFNDVLGTNLSMVHYMTMTRDAGTGVYSFATPDFHPIDNRLLGNEGDANNHYFTYSFTASFTHESCNGQFFGFNGADDAWLFIDGQLVLDIGGIQPGTPQVVEIDRLDLVDGQSYSMQFFYAQRSPLSSEFDLETNVVIVPPAVIATGTASFD